MKRMLALLLAAALCLAAVGAMAEDLITVQYDVEYKYDMARNMLSMVNEARTADKVWQWNEDNKTKTYYSNLPALEYDYALEKVAMQRAAELAISYGHYRPDGSICFTIFPGVSMSENIAAGQTSTSQAFYDWWEEDCDYAGQGHRRALLNPGFRTIGIGCVYSNGKYYWAQALTSGGNYETVRVNPSPITVPVLASNIVRAGSWKITPSAITVNIDESAALPSDVSASGGIFGTTRFTIPNPDWKTDSPLIRISNGQVTGLKAGDAKVYLSSGLNLTLTVHVNDSAPPVLRGDVNGDGMVDGRDVLRLARFLAGENVTADKVGADVNGDGALDGRDVLRLAKQLAD